MHSSSKKLESSYSRSSFTDRYPNIANNGLRVTKRTSQAVTLAWPENDHDVVTFTDSKVSSFELETDLDSQGNWFEVQMKKGELHTSFWETIYKGYGQQCEVIGLPPDTLILFRMKRNGEKRWGTEIIASTDPPPTSAEDLNRAVEMNSEYIVTRILGSTQAPQLKRLLGAHDKNGMTPLMVACHNGNLTIAKMLLSCGAHVNDSSSGVKRTSLMFASIMGKLNIVQLLDQHGADWRLKDKGGCNAMHHAINGGNVAIVRLAFAKLGKKFAFEKDTCGWTPLMRATIISESLDIVKFLVSKGADVNSVDQTNSKSILMAAILSQKVSFVTFLLDWGANPYYKNKNGKNCFEVAKGLGYREIARVVRDRMENIHASLKIKPSYILPAETATPESSSMRSLMISSSNVSSTIDDDNTSERQFEVLPPLPEESQQEAFDMLDLGTHDQDDMSITEMKYLMKPNNPDGKSWL